MFCQNVTEAFYVPVVIHQFSYVNNEFNATNAKN